jgi:hypothetical protein
VPLTGLRSMKKSTAVLSVAFNARRANLPQTTAIVIALSVVLGMLQTGSTDEMIAYLLVVLACGLPLVLWILAGANSIPLLSGYSAMCFIYYAVPILNGHLSVAGFGPSEILSGAFTVALFLIVATISWRLVLGIGIRRSRPAVSQSLSTSYVERIVFLGLIFGIIYHVIISMGGQAWLGSFKGLLRALLISTTTVAFFLAGHARGLGTLRGQRWAVVIAFMSTVIVLSIFDLFLIEGVTYCLATVFGYTMTTKRVPWVFLLAAGIAVTVLSAGKDGMRDKYWSSINVYSRGEGGLLQVPSVILEWVGDGVSELASGNNYNSAVNRASLMQLLLESKRLAPDYIPFLDGKTYAFLPYMLVPRFLYPDKIASQEGMNLLNVHFGFQTAEETQKTARGWGLIAEAYANFGYLGVTGVALVLGLLVGLIEGWSVGTTLTSFPTVVAVTVLIQLINMEADAAGLITTLFQSVAGISMMYWMLGALSKHRARQARSQKVNTADFAR